jgi:hypothetical protein
LSAIGRCCLSVGMPVSDRYTAATKRWSVPGGFRESVSVSGGGCARGKSNKEQSKESPNRGQRQSSRRSALGLTLAAPSTCNLEKSGVRFGGDAAACGSAEGRSARCLELPYSTVHSLTYTRLTCTCNQTHKSLSYINGQVLKGGSLNTPRYLTQSKHLSQPGHNTPTDTAGITASKHGVLVRRLEQ